MLVTLRALAELGTLAEDRAPASASAGEAIALLRPLPDADPHGLGAALTLAAQLALADDDHAAALPLVEEAYRLVRADGVAEPAEVATVASLLATTYDALGRREEARAARDRGGGTTEH